ncbi:hypothetical protein BK007_09975 [Methanobacterium subterraneum]|uniref:Uncharacterized protein n=1 Tax=Methanobacterium subterraneum TaxID=59277 RepID=A0A2H4VDZ0_9EURY|nr:hypothetical protein BK007_09975 [Methanobacterium subterraneum]
MLILIIYPPRIFFIITIITFINVINISIGILNQGKLFSRGTEMTTKKNGFFEIFVKIKRFICLLIKH